MNGLTRWGVAQLFFALSVLCDVCFAISSPSLLSSLGLKDAQLGELGGTYFASFSIALLILGGLMSTIAPRLLLGGSAVVAAIGALLLGSANGFEGALIARVLMGIGLSTAFVGVITYVGREFPQNFAFMAALSNAITNLCSALLAITSSMVPILVGFRAPFRLLALLLMLTAVLLFIILRDGKNSNGNIANDSQSKKIATLTAAELPAAIGRIVRKPQFWYVTLYFGGLFGSFLAYADLWNIPYQLKVFGHPIQHASLLNSAFPIGMTVGSLLGGAWAKRIGFILPLRVFAIITFITEAVLFSTTLPEIGAGLAFFLVGFGCSAASLALAALPEHLEAPLVPIATTFVMTFTYLLSALIQVAAGQPGGGGGITTFSSYQGSIAVIVFPVAIATITAFLIRRKIVPALSA